MIGLQSWVPGGRRRPFQWCACVRGNPISNSRRVRRSGGRYRTRVASDGLAARMRSRTQSSAATIGVMQMSRLRWRVVRDPRDQSDRASPGRTHQAGDSERRRLSRRVRLLRVEGDHLAADRRVTEVVCQQAPCAGPHAKCRRRRPSQGSDPATLGDAAALDRVCAWKTIGCGITALAGNRRRLAKFSEGHWPATSSSNARRVTILTPNLGSTAPVLLGK